MFTPNSKVCCLLKKCLVLQPGFFSSPTQYMCRYNLDLHVTPMERGTMETYTYILVKVLLAMAWVIKAFVLQGPQVYARIQETGTDWLISLCGSQIPLPSKIVVSWLFNQTLIRVLTQRNFAYGIKITDLKLGDYQDYSSRPNLNIWKQTNFMSWSQNDTVRE